MNKPFALFAKITGLIPEAIYFHKKVYTEGNDKKLRKIKGPAIIVCNHTSVYDCPLLMYTFFSRNIRTLMAGEIFEKNKMLTKLLKRLGAIRVDRQSYNFNFLSELNNCLKKGQVGLVFPESRLPKENEKGDLLPFKPSYIYCALQCNVPIIPVYTNGIYGKLKKQNKDRARVMIGKPIYVSSLIQKDKSEKENFEYINNFVRQYIKNLKVLLEEQTKKEKHE